MCYPEEKRNDSLDPKYVLALSRPISWPNKHNNVFIFFFFFTFSARNVEKFPVCRKLLFGPHVIGEVRFRFRFRIPFRFSFRNSKCTFAGTSEISIGQVSFRTKYFLFHSLNGFVNCGPRMPWLLPTSLPAHNYLHGLL